MLVTLSLSSPQASCRLAFAALKTYSAKLSARRSRAVHRLLPAHAPTEPARARAAEHKSEDG
jgi:hypothetical protein